MFPLEHSVEKNSRKLSTLLEFWVLEVEKYIDTNVLLKLDICVLNNAETIKEKYRQREKTEYNIVAT